MQGSGRRSAGRWLEQLNQRRNEDEVMVAETNQSSPEKMVTTTEMTRLIELAGRDEQRSRSRSRKEGEEMDGKTNLIDETGIDEELDYPGAALNSPEKMDDLEKIRKDDDGPLWSAGEGRSPDCNPTERGEFELLDGGLVNSAKSIDKDVKVLKAKLSDDGVLDMSLKAKLVERQGKVDQLEESRKALEKERFDKELNNVKFEVESKRRGLEARQRKVEDVVVEANNTTLKINSVKNSRAATQQELGHKCEEIVNEFHQYSGSIGVMLPRIEAELGVNPGSFFAFSGKSFFFFCKTPSLGHFPAEIPAKFVVFRQNSLHEHERVSSEPAVQMENNQGPVQIKVYQSSLTCAWETLTALLTSALVSAQVSSH
ncbi:hypothetical protein HHK36_030625 [Tetracentron sinense]|uniref:Uncharacterized protein n=1 Tax=Tetracentron sinense TaxID=13715 RepID=A0A834YCW7_TETSI|nr:hypothetical protein HHK36_030625 [Tetracentron sinense]